MSELPAAMSREQRLVLDAMRNAAVAERDGKLVNWDEFRRQAYCHRATGMLSEAVLPGLPRDVLAGLEADGAHVARMNLFLASELLRLIALFADHSIQAVPFKGPVFAERFYGSVSRRVFWDLDLLLQKKDVLAARRLMVSEGYRPEYPWSRTEERMELERNCEYNFDHPVTGIHVELHWRFVPGYIAFGLDWSVLQPRLALIGFMGREVKVIPPEELLVIMCVHNGGKHQWDNLRAILDIDRIICVAGSLEWGRVRFLCREERVGRIVRVGLDLARHFFGTSLPAEVWQWVASDTRVHTLRGEFATRLFGARDSGGELERDSAIEHALRYMRMRERLPDRLRYLPFVARAIIRPTEKEDALLHLPRSWRFVHFYLRPWRLVRKYIARYLFGMRDAS